MKKSNIRSIAIIGSGFVGQATGKGFAGLGHKVTFFDVKAQKVKLLRKDGHGAMLIGDLKKSANMHFDYFMISVPTPTIRKRIDLSYLQDAAADVGRALARVKGFPVVAVRSTVLPGTVENMVVPILEKFSAKKAGKDFGISMNPEFLRQISAEKDFANPWLVVAGADDQKTKEAMERLYRPFNVPIQHMSIREAEVMKYAHNLLNATKISFFNEMRLVDEMIGADSEAVFPAVIKSAEAIWNPRYGIKNYGPYDGACLPKDTQAFYSWALDKLQFEMPVLKGTILTNELVKRSVERKKSALEIKNRLSLRTINMQQGKRRTLA